MSLGGTNEMRKRIDVLESKVESLESECQHLHRQHDMFILQINHDIDVIQAQARRIAKLEAMFRDDYK